MSEAYPFVVCVGCNLRFPGELGVPCPLCNVSTQLAAERCEEADDVVAGAPAPLALLLDNVRSVFNVGSIFRSADGCGATHLYLGGISPTPEHKAMRKTALGAEELIPWSRHYNGAELAEKLVGQGHTLWALERTKGSEELFVAAQTRPKGSLILVLGNEVAGVDPGILAHCQRSVHIPMHGSKLSLNVATAMGIAAYALR